MNYVRVEEDIRGKLKVNPGDSWNP